MASVAREAAVAGRTGDERVGAAGGGGTAAWLCAIPCAAIAAVAILLLGPPLGDLLSPDHSPYTFLSGFAGGVHREPTEHARYLIAIGAPLLGALAIAAAPQWQARVPAPAVGPVVVATQLALAAV